MELCKQELCTGCSACMHKCPKKCISLEDDHEGFLYPQIDYSKCIKCGICFNTCPVNVLPSAGDVLGAFAGVNKNTKERLDSSSGGVFSILAKYIITHDGIVYGACQDEKDFTVRHIGIERIEDIYKLRKSKYVQSKLEDTFLLIKENLKNNRMVLFVGTPCQVAGLKKLIPNNPLLYTVDFICHGVPSQKVWKQYLSALENKYNAKIEKIIWRDKKDGWLGCKNRIFFDNGVEYSNGVNADPYLLSFNESLFLRTSCYQCGFKGINRYSDITLADLWGVNTFAKEKNDNKGISSILLNTEHAVSIFNHISADLEYSTLELENVTKFNSQIINSATKNKNREKFFKCVDKNDFFVAFDTYGPTGKLYTLKKKLKYYISYFTDR